MKAVARIVGLAAIAGAALAAPAPSGAESLGTMRVRLVDGDVQMRIVETGEWAPVAVNTPLLEGDSIWVPDGSRVELQTSDGSYIRLREDTAFDILRMDAGSFQFHLSEGGAYVLSRAPKGGVLQIDTPDASVRAFGKARFRVEVSDGETDIAVFGASVIAESDSGTTKVRRGEMLLVAPGGYAELSPLPEPDEWEAWNRERDRIVLARGESVRHLPDELEVYSGDFDGSGRWVHVREYGYCWTPTVVVDGDWAPYRHGRWIWRGGDYVWIGYEPWGWVPYHYGRWTFVARIGWCWVPPPRGEAFWGPGFVGWVRTPEYVAWVPLAPREVYYGHGNYGRYSVNVTSVNIESIRVTNVYRNVNVVNGVTVVNRTTFVTGRPAPVDRRAAVDAREDFARRRNIVVGRPPIRPVAESHVPVIRDVPEAKRPPPAVRRVDARQLRQARPLVKESDRSILRPEARPRPLEVRRVERARPANERIRQRRDVDPANLEGDRREMRQRAPDDRRMERPPERPQGPPPEKAGPEPTPGATERPAAREPQRRERAVETVPQERGRRQLRETPRGVPGNRRMERPQVPTRERVEAEAVPARPEGGEERGRRDAAPAAGTAHSPPAPAQRGLEQRRRPEAPAERSRPQRSTDNTTRR